MSNLSNDENIHKRQPLFLYILTISTYIIHGSDQDQFWLSHFQFWL